jgi:hypothetical protein
MDSGESDANNSTNANAYQANLSSIIKWPTMSMSRIVT